MRATLLVGVSCVLLGCNTTSESLVSPLDDAAFFDLAKKTVISGLREPESAKFGPSMFRKQSAMGLGTKVDVACGTVNSRNGFGGFTGMKTFAYRSDGRVFIAGEGDQYDRLAADLYCNA